MSPSEHPLQAAYPAQDLSHCMGSAGLALVALPFEIARAQYANAVQCGLLPQSLRAAARYAQSLDALEKLTLGPLARRV
ncbi:hypothetical protein [Rhodoferax aquaticus]|uniref:Uncharacterized protein n=1 Tax=Rhodoferax aquaticus TaxID=2527691 RepID=A0A515EJE0_9BURK|nr:hypothetical protein [Rhodoferax aquaticus]QDL52778.1 hypothetical protein EXZ61_00520 [Rhodoferax aquaticus]